MIDGERLRVLDADAEPRNVGTRIDATDKVVAPGFIDLHSHGGLVILEDPLHEPKVRQGITTEVVGVDGNSFAPFVREEDLEAFVELMAASTLGLDPDGFRGLGFDWTTVASYLALYDGTVSLNIATLVGNSALRIAALGWDATPADDAAIDRMRAQLREAMEDGAFGAVSPGSTTRPARTRPPRSSAALAEEAGKAGGIYHTHVRYALGDRYLDPFREAIDIGRMSGAPAHITHFYHRETHPGPAGSAAGARRQRARQGPRRDVRHLSVRVGQHAPAHPAPAMGPGRRAEGAQGAHRRARGPGSPAHRVRGAGRRLHRARRLGRHPAGWLPSPRAPALGEPDAGRGHGRDWVRTRST